MSEKKEVFPRIFTIGLILFAAVSITLPIALKNIPRIDETCSTAVTADEAEALEESVSDE